ncbi:CHASE4 domain-containing protein [Leptolyngbya sp. O-77]|uniref:CHASE4 domain-containing protein n=1 Tax=Leptolyngbya sp. O-77 TaxID=1080068 RepID=UPI00156072FF|nr:CHASE4 domain-containing protein [Leptolyngbya sp. O-77]
MALGGITTLLFVSSSTILLNSARQVEKLSLTRNLNQVEQALQNQVNILGNAATDYATWDDTYAYAQGQKPGYVSNSIGDVTFTSTQADWLAIARDSQTLLYSATYDYSSGQITSPADEVFEDALLALPKLLQAGREPLNPQGVVLISGQLTLLVSRPILRSNGSGPAVGSFIFGQTLDADKLAKLSKSTQLSLSLHSLTPASTAHQQVLARLKAGEPEIIMPLTNREIAAYRLIYDLHRRPAMLLRIDAPRPVYQQMLLGLRYLALSLLVASTVSGLIIWRLLERSLQYLRERDHIQQVLQQEAALRQSELRYREKAEELELTLQALRETQAQLLHSEKMSSLGQLVAGIAHEINNPISFIYGNVTHARQYAQSLLDLIALYQQHLPHLPQPIQDAQASLDLPFITADLPKLLNSMRVGAERIRTIVLSLRTFSHMDEEGLKRVEIHHGIDSTLLILQHRLQTSANGTAIQVITDYGNLPPVECYPSQLNQVFLNILNNAIDALQSPHAPNGFLADSSPFLIHIQTRYLENEEGKNSKEGKGGDRTDGQIQICIANNGPAIPEDLKPRLFDPFFTTKPVGQGTGLGLTVCYQIIVETHHGILRCNSVPGHHTEFIIQIPVSQTTKRFKA